MVKKQSILLELFEFKMNYIRTRLTYCTLESGFKVRTYSNGLCKTAAKHFAQHLHNG